MDNHYRIDEDCRLFREMRRLSQSDLANKICNVKNMHAVYYAYHSMDPLNAVQRLMEAKCINPDTECTIEAGVRLLRKIRKK